MELDMTKGNPLKLIVKFMIPLIIGNLFQQFYNMADIIIVGRFIGVKALAAVGATGTIMFLLLGFLMGLTSGFTVITAQRFGAGDIEGVRKSVASAIILSAIITVIGTLISVNYMDALLTLMNTPADIFVEARTYIIIICYGFVCTISYNLVSSVLRAVGNSKAPLYFLVVAALLNIVLDLYFIIVLKLGVAGAALATVISQGVAGVLCTIYIAKKVPTLHLKKEHFKLDEYLVKNQLSTGIPMALQYSITAIGTIVVQSALNQLGSIAVAAYTAADKVEGLVTQPYFALGMTMSTFSAQNRGVNDFGRIRQGVRISNIISAIYSVIMAFFIIFFMKYMILLFVSENVAEILSFAQIFVNVTSVFFIPLGMIFIYRNSLQGAGFALIPLLGGVVELVSRVAVAIVAARNLSFTGVCYANVAAWLTTAIFLWVSYQIIFKNLGKKEIRV
ncbi:MAG: MATE family efflux transporter [Clostridiales bacterium]|nr:MATE family efflux transporter [Clostridiales bacterium]